MTRFPALLSRLKAGKEKEFSFLIFAICAPLQLTLVLTICWLIAPSLMRQELVISFWGLLAIFGTLCCFKVFNCFFEHFFHRYLLHTAPFAWFARLAQQHRMHHKLTRVAAKQAKDGGSAIIESRYPIVETHQHEASFFPYYGLSFFFLVFTLIIIPVKLLIPGAPILLGGYFAVFLSYCLYEIWHAVQHLDFEEFWRPKVEHPRWGWLWTKVYGFHLRHHAVHKCNQNISGFFLFALADIVLGTFKSTRRLLLNGKEVEGEDFLDPRPLWVIRKLDEFFERRELARSKKRQALARR